MNDIKITSPGYESKYSPYTFKNECKISWCYPTYRNFTTLKLRLYCDEIEDVITYDISDYIQDKEYTISSDILKSSDTYKVELIGETYSETGTHYSNSIYISLYNRKPTISSRDFDLGPQKSKFHVTYQVNDNDLEDSITIVEKLNGTILRTINNAERNTNYILNITDSILSKLPLNTQHKITVEVNDNKGGVAYRKYTFSRLNTAPTISNKDCDLGGWNSAFYVTYQVDDEDNDPLTIIEKLNGKVLRTLSNPPKKSDITLNITKEDLNSLPLNKTNTISIQAYDGKGGVAYRNFTFTRINSAPIISGKDSDLGAISKDINKKYTVSDEEGNEISIVEKIDNITLKTFKAEANKEYKLNIPKSIWIKLNNGKHKFTIAATDSNGATSIRTFSFRKSENQIVIDLKKPFVTDDKANKILITPVWQNIEKANIKVETCNNGLDLKPTWEDCTKEVLNNTKFTFKNNSKTAEKWGINIKFSIEKKEGVQDEVYFNGFGGAFE